MGFEERAVEAIIKDLSDRRGLKSEWGQIDRPTQREIKLAWATLIRDLLRGLSPKTAKPDACDCCNFETTEIKAYKNTSERWLCSLCAGTMVGSYYEYPNQIGRETMIILQTICHVGNAILKEIRDNA